jgi:hypothetical protein
MALRGKASPVQINRGTTGIAVCLPLSLRLRSRSSSLIRLRESRVSGGLVRSSGRLTQSSNRVLLPLLQFSGINPVLPAPRAALALIHRSRTGLELRACSYTTEILGTSTARCLGEPVRVKAVDKTLGTAYAQLADHSRRHTQS